MSDSSTNTQYGFADYCVKKAEKISNAVYILSNFISAEDPLRSTLRKNVLELLSDMYGLRKSQKTKGDVYHFVFKGAYQTIPEAISLITIAQNSGFITAMNASIINGELSTLKKEIAQHFDTDKIMDISAQDFSVPRLAEGAKYRSTTMQKEYSQPKTSTTRPKPSQNNTGSRVAQKRNRRREIIIKLLKEKGKLAIKDVAKELPQYSEKTLQRELLKMTNEGLVSKEGERRWTRYSLI